MGTGNLTNRSNGGTIDQTWFDTIQDALEVDLVPRDGTGAPTNESGSLGDSSHAWLRAYISSGHFSAGDIKLHHSFNGTIPAGEGWMKCDGRQVTQANYDTEHGSGHWDTYVVSSTLLNLHLPDMRGRFPAGASTGTTTQTGATAITAVGNASNQISLSHSHTMNSHSHNVNGHTHSISSHNHGMIELDGSNNQQGYNGNLASLSDLKDHCTTSATATGWLVATGNVTTTTGTVYGIVTPGAGTPNNTGDIVSDGSGNPTGSAAPTTDSQTPTMNSQLSTTQSIKPDSIELEYYMRII